MPIPETLGVSGGTLYAPDALESRLKNNSLGDRSTYVGASEVGGCMRQIVHEKLNGRAFDHKSAGPMLLGKALENEVVQILRAIHGAELRYTGANQLTFVDPHSPMKCHPDGILGGEEIIEIKTCNGNAFKKYVKGYDKLPIRYRYQVQVNMGLAEHTRARLILASRDNLELHQYEVPFDPAILADARERAWAIMAGVEAGVLPLGEPERAWNCRSCPCYQDCPQARAQMGEAKEGGLPLTVALDVEVALDRLAEITPAIDALAAEDKALRDQIKEAMAPTGVKSHEASNAIAVLSETSRTTLDSKGLKAVAPDVYEQFSKESKSVSLKITFKE